MKSMRFKVGDHVRIKSIDWYNKNKNKIGFICFDRANFIPEMSRYCGEILTINRVVEEFEQYLVSECAFSWTDEMIEGLVEEPTVFNGKEFLLRLANIELPSGTTTIWECPDGYQFVDENGNVINAMKIVLEKKKKEYPKTYEECSEIIAELTGSDCNPKGCMGYMSTQLTALQKLLICRDVYWKIAGEEMGLGKPWIPDWKDCTKPKYTIHLHCDGHIFGQDVSHTEYRWLSFPTAEMRDAFYENFKSEIEMCKEFL